MFVVCVCVCVEVGNCLVCVSVFVLSGMLGVGGRWVEECFPLKFNTSHTWSQHTYMCIIPAYTHVHKYIHTRTLTPVGGLFGGPGGLDQQQLLELINQGVLGPLEGGGIGRALAEAGG